MSNCGTCKRWNTGKIAEESPHAYDDKDMRPCGAIPHTSGAPDEALAVAEDASGYSAHLLTRASFGCVLHAPQEGAAAP